MTPPTLPVPPKWMPYLHMLAMAFGMGASTYLVGVFAIGMPTTQATWRALVYGCLAAGLSRLFGALFNKVGP